MGHQRAEVAGRAGRGRRSSCARGFTLIEIIVTLFVLAVALALAVPVVGRTTDTIRTRSEVAGFSALLRHAREKAITTRRTQSVVVDPEEHRVTITAGADETHETRAVSPRLTIEAKSSTGLTVRFAPEGTSSGGEFRLASGSTVYRVLIDPITGRVKSQRE